MSGILQLMMGCVGNTVGFPVQLDLTASNFSTDTTNHAASLSATVNNLDLLVAGVAVDGGSGATTTTPAGWTLLLGTNNGVAVRGAVYYRIANGTEGGTTVDFVTSVAETMAVQIARIQAGTYQGIPEAASATGSSATPNPPNLATSWGSAATHWLAMKMSGAPAPITAYPYASGQLDTPNSGVASDATKVGTASCYADIAAASQDPGTFTSGTSAAWVAFTVAVRPA